LKPNCVSSLFLSFLLFLSTAFLAGCGERELNSKWRNREIIVDGIDTEWEGARLFLDKEKVTIGLLNDENDLYVRISSRDRTMQSQILMRGLTIWFDSKGDRKKTFGIHFPIGMRSDRREMMSRENPDNTDLSQKMIEIMQNELEICGTGEEDITRLLTADIKERGVNVKMGSSKGNLVCELKVPLAKSELQPYAIGADTTKIIGIGFETGKMDREEMSKMVSERRGQRSGIDGGRTGDRGGIGDMGGMGGGRGGRGGMRPGGGQLLDSLELWVKTKLASEPMNKL